MVRDKIYPVITLGFYFGEKELGCWYRLDNLEIFHSDLQVILGLLKCRKDKQKLKEYIKNNDEFFINVDMETGMAISSFMNSESLMNKLENRKKGEGVDMCKALEDWAAEERAQGKTEGKIEGKTEAKIEAAGNLIGLLDYETIAEKTGLSLEVVKELGNQKKK